MPRRRGDRLDALCPFSFLVSSNAGDPGLGHQIAILPMTMGSNHLITRVQIPVAALILEKVEKPGRIDSKLIYEMIRYA